MDPIRRIQVNKLDKSTIGSTIAPLGTDGVVPSSYLGSGTAGTSTYLRGDGTWAVPPAGSGGGGNEVGTNIGTGGVGLYVDKSGDYLRFRNIGPASSKVTVTAGTNNMVNLDVDANATVAASTDSRLSDARTPTAHTHAGSDISTGTIATARLGSGTATVNTFLRGDQAWADPYIARLVLASDVSTAANTTPVDLTGMSFSFAANSTYVFDIYGLVSSAAATTGCGFAIDVSASVTSIGLMAFHQLANTGTLTGCSSIADNTFTGVSSGVPTLNTNVPVRGGGLLVTGANTGTAQFRYRAEVAAVTTCKAGTTIIVTKVA